MTEPIRCTRCEGLLIGNRFLVKTGAYLDPATYNTRVCRYGRPKGGCINHCQTIVQNETFEARSNPLKGLHPEAQEFFDGL
jgi:hypothetical protein